MLHCPGTFAEKSPSLLWAESSHLKLSGPYSAKQRFNPQTSWDLIFADASYSNSTLLPPLHLVEGGGVNSWLFTQKVDKMVSVGRHGIIQLPCSRRSLISAIKRKGRRQLQGFWPVNSLQILECLDLKAFKSKRTHKMQFGLCTFNNEP